MNKDITAIFLTCNDLPKKWEAYHKSVLLESLNGAPLITISMIPTDMGTGINILQDRPKSMSNIYFQLLRGAKMATTDYIAVAESDTLYSKEHFRHRPSKDKVGFNMCHWSLFTWGEPMYSWRNRRGNYSMICSRDLVIEALEERFKKYPDGTPDKITGEIARPMVERNLGITLREAEEFETSVGIVNFNHSNATDDLQLRQRKNWGPIRAYDIPFWGKASDLVKKWV